MRFSYTPPTGWDFVNLEELTLPLKGAIRIGPFGSALKKHEYSDEGIRVLGIEDVHPNRFVSENRKYIPEAKFQELTQYEVSVGDVLVTNMGTVGRACWVPPETEKSIISSHLIKVSLDTKKADPNYLCWMLNFCPLVVAQIRAKCHGAIMAGFNSSLLKSLQIPLPPLAEQKRIAAILDAADGLRAKRRESLAQLDALLQSTFLDMFGDPASNSKGWKELSIGEVAKLGTGSTPSRKQTENFIGDIPWVKSTEVDWGTIVQTSEKVSAEGQKSARLKLYPKDSIILALYGQGKTRGKSALLGMNAAINQACCAIVPKDICNNLFMFAYLKHSYHRLRGESRGGNQENLNMGIVRKFSIPLPPLDLQRRFATIVESVEQQKARLRSHLDELDTLFASLQQRAFNGEL